MTAIEIAGRKVGPGHPCFIIAEAGVNHNGVVAVVDASTGKIVHQIAMAGADDDLIRASIVVAHNQLLIRTNDTLFCVAQSADK